MDPFTLVIIAGIGFAAFTFHKREQERATAAAVAEAQAAPAPAEGEPTAGEPDISSILSGGAAIALVTVGVSLIAGALARREAREAERAANEELLRRIADAVRQLTFKDMNGVPDADILAVFEGAVGVPACVSLAFTPGWQAGARHVALALSDMRHSLKAPETEGGVLVHTTPRPDAIYAYYTLKGKEREGVGRSIIAGF